MRLLLVEDKDSFRRLLVQALQGSTWEVRAVGDPLEALDLLQRDPFDVLVTDLRLPSLSGLELLKRARRLRPALRVLLMSAFGEPRDIVEAVRWGADDFLPKPFDLDHFLAVLERLGALVEAPPPDPREPWVAQSPALRELEEGLSRAATLDLPVLFTGEPGSGRSRAARRLHTLRHPHAPFLPLGAEALGPEGPEPRTLALLQGGSLHISDLEALPPTHIPGLLRALEQGGIHWMAGVRDPASLPERLRERLGVLTFPVPPLARRREDIIPLFRALLAFRARQLGRPVPLVDRAVEVALLGRAWPGQVRELAWCLDQALQATQGMRLAALPLAESPSLVLPCPGTGSLAARLEAVRLGAEAEILGRTLRDQGFDLPATAQALGLTPRALAQRLREHRIPIEDEA
jgi:DNA-binding NtrC family response regulator